MDADRSPDTPASYRTATALPVERSDTPRLPTLLAPDPGRLST